RARQLWYARWSRIRGSVHCFPRCCVWMEKVVLSRGIQLSRVADPMVARLSCRCNDCESRLGESRLAPVEGRPQFVGDESGAPRIWLLFLSHCDVASHVSREIEAASITGRGGLRGSSVSYVRAG